MKRLILSLITISFISLNLPAQINLAKQWDHTYGGILEDHLTALMKTSDGGFILTGFTQSDSGYDVTQATRGGFDYWIVRTDSLGDKIWDKRFGGTGQDKLYSVDQTYDGGFIFGGFVGSDSIGGDVSQAPRGSIDFWIVRTDANGNKLWDRRYGGNNADQLNCIRQTSDSGFILGGFTDSDTTGEVTIPPRGGSDFWMVKVDKNGNKQWDKRFGGETTDEMWFLQQTSNGGYILGGITSSADTLDVSQPSRGASDYWIVRTDGAGNKIWDRRFGGDDKDYFLSLQQTTDGGYILGGFAGSDMSGDVSEPTRDTSFSASRKGDFWIVRIDTGGTKLWDHRFGGFWVEDSFGYVTQTLDGGFLLGGSSYSGISGDKSENNFGYEQSWFVKTDSMGTKLWDKTVFTDAEDEYGYVIQVSDSCYVIANYSEAHAAGMKSENSRGQRDFWFIKFCETQVPQLPVANFTVSSNSTCQTGCVSFQNTSTNASSFQWIFEGASDSTSTIASPSNVCYPNTGSYTVILIATNGSGSDTLVQTNFIQTIPLTPVVIYESGDTLFSTQGFIEYDWYFNGVQQPNDTNYFLVSPQTGEYVVVAVAPNGCPNSDTVSFTVGVSEYSAAGLEIRVFPNPAHNEIHVTGIEGNRNGELRIFDMTGRIIFRTNKFSDDLTIPVGNLTPGLYILEAYSDNQKYFIRFIKE